MILQQKNQVQGWWASRPTKAFLPNETAQLVLQGDAYDCNYGIKLTRYIHGNTAEQYT